MADRFAILGQLALADETETVLYTVPVAAATTVAGGTVEVAPKVLSRLTQTVVSSVIVCNRDAGEATYYIRLKASGETDDDKEYIFSDTAISGKKTQILSLALTLSAGDSIEVKAGSGDSNKLSFTAMGIEVT